MEVFGYIFDLFFSHPQLSKGRLITSWLQLCTWLWVKDGKRQVKLWMQVHSPSEQFTNTHDSDTWLGKIKCQSTMSQRSWWLFKRGTNLGRQLCECLCSAFLVFLCAPSSNIERSPTFIIPPSCSLFLWFSVFVKPQGLCVAVPGILSLAPWFPHPEVVTALMLQGGFSQFLWLSEET